MRRDPEEFGEEELELFYIAGRLQEAKKIEAILDGQGIDYAIQVEHYRAGVIFASVRAGAFFYALPAEAARSRETLKRLGYKVQEPLP
ncbi:MAG: hypothetical protein HY236_15695 [Acidobacteria bacterium]|nr:hypothetical protein [Acidobacteriota bacterium]